MNQSARKVCFCFAPTPGTLITSGYLAASRRGLFVPARFCHHSSRPMPWQRRWNLAAGRGQAGRGGGSAVMQPAIRLPATVRMRAGRKKRPEGAVIVVVIKCENGSGALSKKRAGNGHWTVSVDGNRSTARGNAQYHTKYLQTERLYCAQQQLSRKAICA